jgi:hypothetical protein
MSSATTADEPYRYDVFVSYCLDDQVWVQNRLVPELDRAGLRVFASYRDARAGMPHIQSIEQAVEQSRHTIAVLSPGWILSEWNAFEELQARTLDPAARRRRLIPALLMDCTLPKRIADLEQIDLRDEARQAPQIQRLIRDIQDTLPLPLPLTTPGQRSDARAWGRWLRRYRRELRRGAVSLIVLYLVLAVLVQWPPFQSRQGWGELGPNPPVEALALQQIGGVLLLGSATDFPGCSPDTGIWRGLDHGRRWEPVSAPLAITEGPCPRLAGIKAFAHSPAAPRRIYAATSDAGLLRSDGRPDIGLGWASVGAKQLPAQLRNVVVMPTDAEQLFVAAEPGNLFHSTDGGGSWRQLDGRETCSDTARGASLPAPIDPQAMLATRDAVYVGTRGSSTAASPYAGLYTSTDGGRCWRLLHDGKRRYRYLGLAEHRPDAVLVLTYDFQGLDGEEFQLWEIYVSGGQPHLLWQSGTRAVAVYVDARAPRTWYIVDGMGALLRHSFDADSQQRPEVLGRITRCILACNLALAPDLDTLNTSVPLLLADDRVYRLGEVPWYRALWP